MIKNYEKLLHLSTPQLTLRPTLLFSRFLEVECVYLQRLRMRPARLCFTAPTEVKNNEEGKNNEGGKKHDRR